MDIRREFAARPPREVLTSLAALVRDWEWRTAPGGGLDLKRDDVVEFCRDAPSWGIAVDRAVASRRPNGKMHNHQSKVKEADRRKFGQRIMRAVYWTNRGVPWECENRVVNPSAESGGGVTHNRCHHRKLTNFDALHDLMEAVRPHGIGPVTTYDVAVRIGAYAAIEPQSLYLHAGVRAGWRALMPTAPFGVRKNWAGVDRLPVDFWPAPLKRMKADDLEDFLCTYRTIFPDLFAGPAEEWKRANNFHDGRDVPCPE